MRAVVICLLIGAVWAQDPQALFRQAVEAQQRGDDRTAVQHYQQLVKLYPKVVEVRANLGAVLARMGRVDEAIEQYRAALALAPGNAGLEWNLALAYYKKNDWTATLRQLEPMRRAAPTDLKLALLAADCQAKLDQPQRVLETLGPLEPAHAADLGLEWLLGSALVRTGHPREGMKRLEKVGRQGGRAEALLLAGQAALELSEFELARDYAEEAAKLDGRLAGLDTLRGKVRQFLSDNPGAIEALRRAVAADANDFEAHLTLGAVLHTERQNEEARKELDRALALRPESPEAHYQLGRLERTEGHVETAVAHLEKVVKARPEWAQAHVELSALYFRLGRQVDGERERAAFDRLNEKK